MLKTSRGYKLNFLPFLCIIYHKYSILTNVYKSINLFKIKALSV